MSFRLPCIFHFHSRRCLVVFFWERARCASLGAVKLWERAIFSARAHFGAGTAPDRSSFCSCVLSVFHLNQILLLIVLIFSFIFLIVSFFTDPKIYNGLAEYLAYVDVEMFMI